MKIKNMKVIDMKGNLVNLCIKKYEVEPKDRQIVKNFLEELGDLKDEVEFNIECEKIIEKYLIQTVIKESIWDLLDIVGVLPLHLINENLDKLNKYFDMTQIKYFKCLGIVAIYQIYQFEYKHKLMKQYFDKYKENVVNVTC